MKLNVCDIYEYSLADIMTDGGTAYQSPFAVTEFQSTLSAFDPLAPTQPELSSDAVKELLSRHLLPHVWNKCFYYSASDVAVSEKEAGLVDRVRQAASWLISSSTKYKPILSAYETEKNQLTAQLSETYTDGGTSTDTFTRETTSSGTSSGTSTGTNADSTMRSDMPVSASLGDVGDEDVASGRTQSTGSGTTTDSGTTSGTGHTADSRTKTVTRTKSHSKDVATAMARLDEIQRLYKSTHERWADEFIKEFIIF